MIKKIIWRVLGYLLYSVLVLFITVQIGLKAMNGRKAKYQAKYVNEWYKKAVVNENTSEEQKDNYNKRYILESVALKNGILNTCPVYETTIKEEDYTDKPSDILTFKLSAFQVDLASKKKLVHGFILFFQDLRHGVKQESNDYLFYDLGYKGGVDSENKYIPSIFEKKFNKDLLKEHTFKIGFTLSNTKAAILKGKEKGLVTPTLFSHVPLFFTETSLLADAGKNNPDEKYAFIKSMVISKVSSEDQAKETQIVSISEPSFTDTTSASLKNKTLNLRHDKYSNSTLEEIKALTQISKSKGSEENPVTLAATEKKLVKLSVEKALNEFNTIPAVTITVVCVLILTATYFLFVHKIVKAKKAAKKDKKEKEEDPGFSLDKENAQEADFKEVKNDEKLPSNDDQVEEPQEDKK